MIELGFTQNEIIKKLDADLNQLQQIFSNTKKHLRTNKKNKAKTLIVMYVGAHGFM